ncbi:hypothetical protein U1Q18_031444 [Sarracenia purpurea var. burkii]
MEAFVQAKGFLSPRGFNLPSQWLRQRLNISKPKYFVRFSLFFNGFSKFHGFETNPRGVYQKNRTFQILRAEALPPGTATAAAADGQPLFVEPESPPNEDSCNLENLNAVKETLDEDDSNVLIECKDVYKSFGEKHILRGVSFKIRRGEALGIIGPSGTGKSTILKIMAGLLAPDKGEVFIRGRRRHGLISDEEISGLRIGLVFQSAALFDSLTVRENVGFLLYENSTMSDDQIAALVTETLAAVGLKGAEDRLPSELSGGMKKRVALARSIIFDTTKDAIEPEVCVIVTDILIFVL